MARACGTGSFCAWRCWLQRRVGPMTPGVAARAAWAQAGRRAAKAALRPVARRAVAPTWWLKRSVSQGSGAARRGPSAAPTARPEPASDIPTVVARTVITSPRSAPPTTGSRRRRRASVLTVTTTASLVTEDRAAAAVGVGAAGAAEGSHRTLPSCSRSVSPPKRSPVRSAAASTCTRRCRPLARRFSRASARMADRALRPAATTGSAAIRAPVRARPVKPVCSPSAPRVQRVRPA